MEDKEYLDIPDFLRNQDNLADELRQGFKENAEQFDALMVQMLAENKRLILKLKDTADLEEIKNTLESKIFDLNARVRTVLDIYFLYDREGLLEAMQKLVRQCD